MTLIAKTAKRVDPAFLFLLFFVIAMNLPYLDPEFMVGHDTKNIFVTFHYFFSHLSSHGELPRWLPFGEYGYSSLFYQISNLSPFSYFAGLIGWAVGATDTLLLFKLSVLAEQCAFLLGLYLLGQRLFKNRITTILISLCGAGSVIWYWQLYWDFRLYYLLPLTFYCYHRFIEDKEYWALGAGTLILMLSLVGGLAYWAPVFAYLFLVMGLIIVCLSWRSFRPLPKPSLRDLPIFLLLVLSVAALGYILSTCLAGLHNYSPGRSLDGMRTELQTFLTYTPPENWWMLHAFLDGTGPNTLSYKDIQDSLSILPDGTPPDDLTLYVGLLPLFGLVVALVKVRSKWFYCFFGGLAALVALAGTGLSSWLLYHVMPGMNMFRHLALLLEIAKVLLLVAGGFGLDYLAGKIQNRDWLLKKLSPFNLSLTLFGLLFILDMVVSITVHRPDSWKSPVDLENLLPTGGGWIATRLSVWAVVLIAIFILPRIASISHKTYRAVLFLLLIAGATVDMAGLQGFYWDNHVVSNYVGRLEIEPLRFQQERYPIPSDDIVRKDAVLTSSPAGIYHGYYANALQFDPCAPSGWVDIFPQGVHKLLSARGSVPTWETLKSKLSPPNDPEFRKLMACRAPKLRFVPGAFFSNSDHDLAARIKDSSEFGREAVLKGDPAQSVPPAWDDPDPMGYIVKSFNANHLDLEVYVRQGNPGWLVYADSYSPMWKAYDNGREVPILEAYMAFKAIHLDPGRHLISFRYENSLQWIAMSWLMFVSISLAFLTASGVGWQIVKRNKPAEHVVRHERDEDQAQ